MSSDASITSRERAEASRLFRAEILPRLRDYEAERRRALRLASVLFVLSCVLYVGGIYFGIAYEPPNNMQFQPWTFLYGIGSPLLFYFLVRAPSERFKGGFTAFLFKTLGKIRGPLAYDPKPESPKLDPKLFCDMDLVEGEVFSSVKNEISGARGGASFAWGRATFSEYYAGGRQTIYYEAMLMQIQTGKALRGTIQIRPYVGRIDDFFTRKFQGMTRLEINNASFAERYTVYADDAQEASAVMTPTLVYNLMLLADFLSARKVDKRYRFKLFEPSTLAFGFSDERFLLAIHLSAWSGDRFLKQPGITRPLAKTEETLVDLLFQIGIIHKIADILRIGEARGSS